MKSRYHRSVKILPGVKVNLNKKSTSVTIGGKYARTTINKKRGTCTESYSTPIKGLSYQKTHKLNKRHNDRITKEHPPLTYKIAGILSLIFGIPIALLGLVTIMVGGVIIFIPALLLIFLGVTYLKKAKQMTTPIEDDTLSTCSDTPDGSYNVDLAVEQLENCSRILNDCSRLLQETRNPDTFFSRLDLLEEQLDKMKEIYEQTGITVSPSPDGLLEALNKDKEEIIYDFIGRYYNATFDKAEKLKTDKGKRNCYQKFFDTLDSYSDYINERNQAYINYKRRYVDDTYPKSE